MKQFRTKRSADGSVVRYPVGIRNPRGMSHEQATISKKMWEERIPGSSVHVLKYANGSYAPYIAIVGDIAKRLMSSPEGSAVLPENLSQIESYIPSMSEKLLAPFAENPMYMVFIADGNSSIVSPSEDYAVLLTWKRTVPEDAEPQILISANGNRKFARSFEEKTAAKKWIGNLESVIEKTHPVVSLSVNTVQQLRKTLSNIPDHNEVALAYGTHSGEMQVFSLEGEGRGATIPINRIIAESGEQVYSARTLKKVFDAYDSATDNPVTPMFLTISKNGNLIIKFSAKAKVISGSPLTFHTHHDDKVDEGKNPTTDRMYLEGDFVASISPVSSRIKMPAVPMPSGKP